jgi:hypothetical protein
MHLGRKTYWLAKEKKNSLFFPKWQPPTALLLALLEQERLQPSTVRNFARLEFQFSYPTPSV